MTTTADLATTLAAIDDVDGWLTLAQARRLWRAAREVSADGRIVEIGSFRGRSTIVLAKASAAPVVAVDPHAGTDRGPQELRGFEHEAAGDHEVFNANLERAGVASRVRHLRRFSHDALDEVDGAIDLLFVDGAHRFGPARDDIAAWGGRVRPGGTLLVHDAFSSVGVTLALLATTFFGRDFRFVGRDGSLVEFRRETLRPRGRAANALRQAALLPVFLRNVAVKVLLLAGLRRLTPLLGHRSEDWPY